MVTFSASTAASALVALFVSRWIWQYFRDPLKDIPGKSASNQKLINRYSLTYLQGHFGVDLHVFGNFQLSEHQGSWILIPNYTKHMVCSAKSLRKPDTDKTQDQLFASLQIDTASILPRISTRFTATAQNSSRLHSITHSEIQTLTSPTRSLKDRFSAMPSSGGK